jgi:acyl transferase domain-containing protein/NAD(P)H-dependent flavin oxidoreductase YrpB (nitropropane dioxygenase family)/NAD(P)-dependent dehydrogenase (short-subunit alcohol dehydrogenase family)
VLVAAGKARALAVVDNCGVQDASALRNAVLDLSGCFGGYIGIRTNARSLERVASVLESLGTRIDLILLSGESDGDGGAGLSASIENLRRFGNRIFREVISQEEALEAVKAGVDGLVAKGNEAAGRVGSETSFVLLQRLLSGVTVPVWAYGGIGPHGAVACRVAGAAGIVLQDEIALAEECSIPEPLRSRIAAMDGSETICLGESLGCRFRVHRQEGVSLIRELQQLEISGAGSSAFVARLDEILERSDGPEVLPVGQGVAFAGRLAREHRNVAGILRAYRSQMADNLRIATSAPPIAENSPFAQAHGIRYPVFQGPMTRVSDVAGFADAVSRGGGLPFLALALLRQAECERLLEQTAVLMGERPWGVGILAFVPQELRVEQLKAVLKVRPRFAILAGGRQEQASSLEAAGIRTYIHAPSPQLLEMFLRQGGRRFIFEGRECGGHVGPLSSFVLWESVIETLVEFQRKSGNKEALDIVFAGGIHDGRSAAMVSALSASASALGIRIGILMGTAYLFTHEAVDTGAIVPLFQDEAVRCVETVLLDMGGGHAIRCAPSAYTEEFEVFQRELREQGLSADEIRRRMEEINVGRLRIASKGVARSAPDNGSSLPSQLVEVSIERQKTDGMYMMGQIAALREGLCSIEELHQQVCRGAVARLGDFASGEEKEDAWPPRRRDRKAPEPIAIVGMACHLPAATDLVQYWANILRRHDAIEEVPSDRWPSGLFYDADPKVPDRTVSKWGGFMAPIRLNPMTYGIPPATLSAIEPVHLIMMEVTRKALADAGYDRRPFARENTAVILGFPGGILDLGQFYITRCLAEFELNRMPGLDPALREQLMDYFRRTLPELTEDSFPGILGNVAAGRLANRFDLGGPNFTVDAACATSLAALQTGIQELRHGTSEVALVGAAEAAQTTFAYLLFSKTGALSPRGRCRPFDATADGIATSEGVAMLVLKRLSDAERDGDRIYAVVRSVGSSSDGRDKSLTAPAVRGQTRAVLRAYEPLEFSPSSVELVEAHGTGTVVGDRTEIETLRAILQSEGARPQSCALGSVKSQIGHTKGTAGLAGLIKVALALHHRVLPPTLVEDVAPALRDRSIPMYLNTRARPWFHADTSPRRGAVSAFGFGGTNFHTVLEEYGKDFTALQARPAELFVFRAASRGELASQLTALEGRLAEVSQVRLVELAEALSREVAIHRGDCRLAIVARDLQGLRSQLATAADKLTRNEPFSPVEPIVFGETTTSGPVAFLFPGQGSQYPNMLEELALCFPLVREVFEAADVVLNDALPKRLSEAIFPPPAYSPSEETEQSCTLNQTWFAQPALGAAGYALFSLLKAAGIEPDVVAGHSYGEYVALCTAGVFSFSELMRISEQRGRAVQETQGTESVQMVAVQADVSSVSNLLRAHTGVAIAGANAPDQTIVGGGRIPMESFLSSLDAAKIRYQKLAMSAGFHIPEAQAAAGRFAEALARVELQMPRWPVYSNLEAAPYATEAEAIREILVKQLTQPLRFQEEIEAIYAAGVRDFVEVGPGNVLSGLVQRILGDRPAVILTTNKKGSESGLADYLKVIGWFYAAGRAVRLEKLFPACDREIPELAELLKGEEPPKPTEWIVTGGSARPMVQKTPAPAKTVVAATTGGSVPLPKPASQPMVRAPSSTSTPGSRPNINAFASNPNGPSREAPQRPVQLAPPVAPPAAFREVPAAPAPTAALNVSGSGSAGNGHFEHVVTAFQTTMQQFLDYQLESNRQRQELMSRFLDTQRAMVEVLAGNGGGLHLSAASTAPAFTSPPQVAPAPLLPDLSRTVTETVAPVALSASVVVAPPEPQVVAAETQPQPEPAATSPAASLYETLLALISKRTGYPPEMLELDQNLEADLGIDSIKRAEIFGALLEDLGLGQSDQEREEYFLAISKLRSLREVLAWLGEQTEGKEAAQPAPATVEAQQTHSASEERELRRFLVRAIAEPLNGAVRKPRADEVVLLTEDHSGRARAEVAGLSEVGVKVAVVRHSPESRVVAPGIYEVDLTSRTAVRQLREWVSEQYGKVTTLCHFLPLDSNSNAPGSLELESLLTLATTFGPDLREKKGCLFALTGAGGKFGIDNGGGEFRPGAAAIPPFLKSLSHEWPEVSMKCVDLDPRDGDEVLAHILAELSSADPKVEVGYTSGHRFVLETYESELDKQRAVRPPLDRSSIVLVTGGARGITAAICRELAARFHPTLILVGRTAIPEPEGPETLGLEGAAELKRAIVERRKSRSQLVTPGAVEGEYQAILRGREVRANLDQLTSLGARCEYHSLDIRDSAAFEALIHSVYDRHGRIDGVIHGAGIVEDHMFDAKSPESFHRVFDTKVGSALVLARALRPESLRFLFFLSSLAARHGYAGGTDYSSANEVLNNLARKLDREWEARVVAIGWGPWAEVGIASRYPPELLKERGVVYHSVEIGVRSFINELLFGSKGEPEAYHFIPGDKPVLE